LKNPDEDDQIPLNFNEDSLYPDGLLNEIPGLGVGIDFTTDASNQQTNKSDANLQKGNVVDLSKALFQSFDDSLLNMSAQSYLDESSLASLSFQQNENDITLSELLTQNESEDHNQISELWTKKKGENGGANSRSSSGSSSPNIDDLITKRKVKKYAIEADAKLVKSFDEIKPKLAHQVKVLTVLTKFLFDFLVKFIFFELLVGIRA
jgi:hypothetical protein